MNLSQLQQYKPQILEITQQHGVGNVRVFGSIARGDGDDASDVDLLVTIEKPIGWDFFSLGSSLEALLNVKVDVVSDDAIRARLRTIILSKAIQL